MLRALMRALNVKRLRIEFVAFWLGLLALLFAALVHMNRDVSRQIDELAIANSDSAQWALAQSEVELFALISAISDARADPSLSLSEVRARFDVFYSRARTLASSPLLQPLREDPVVITALGNVDAYLVGNVPLIDGDDATLRNSLEGFRTITANLRADVREINLRGVGLLSRLSDDQRRQTAEMLGRVSIVAIGLFFLLMLTAALLLVFFFMAQQRAREQSQIRSRLGAMVSSSLDAVIAVNSVGKIMDFNGSAERIFGYSREEAIGQQMEDLIVPDHLKAAHEAGMDRYRTTREKHVIGKGRIQLEARRKNGEVFPVELSLETSESEEGEIFVSFLRDISHRVAAEQELIKARDEAVAGEKAKADLIAVMSHEMRTPLNGMLGTLDLLDQASLSPKHLEYLNIIRASGKLLLHHVDDVLEISRAEAGKIEIAARPFSVSALIKELVDSQRSVAEHRANTLSMLVDTQGEDHVIGDQTRIRQFLLNLIGNAIKFTRNGSVVIEVTRLATDDLMEFRVTDTGIGIAPEDRERVFDDFVTLDPSFSRAVGGTGLGLAIVRRLVKVMGGETGLESSVGYGSSFWVRLPLPVASAEDIAQSAVAESVDADSPVAPMKILVVEDNRFNRVVARDLLELDGHSVDEAFDGRQGVEAVKYTRYDLVLMDISMPIMDGVEATRTIRETEPEGTHLPIVALTANAIPAERERFFAAGLDDILIKPISMRGLRELVRRHSTADQGVENEASSDKGFAATIDHGHLKELSEALGDAKIHDLVGDFLREAGAAVSEISAALKHGDIPAGLAEKVHHVAGSAALVGAEALRTALSDLENRLDAGEVPDPDAGRQLADIWSRTVPELQIHLGSDET